LPGLLGLSGEGVLITMELCRAIQCDNIFLSSGSCLVSVYCLGFSDPQRLSLLRCQR
jgi:hypothetical protein